MAEAHLNLAYAYQLLSQPKAALAEYKTACHFDPQLCKFVPAQ